MESNTRLESAIDYWIDGIESKTNIRCPIENKKNAYLKACWILSIYQSANLAFGGHDGEMLKTVEELKSMLPKLREMYHGHFRQTSRILI